jgi:hypothetical protein
MPNKPKTRQLAKKAGFLFTVFCLGLVLSLAVGFFYNVISNHYAGARLDKIYSRASIPKSLKLSSKQYDGTPYLAFWSGPSASGPPQYTYTYKPVSRQTIKQAYDSLTASLSSSGYAIEHFMGSPPNYIVLDASTKQLCLSASINSSSNNPNSPNAGVSNVWIGASPPPCD